MTEDKKSAKPGRFGELLDTSKLYSEDAEIAVIGCMMSQPAEVIEEALNVPIVEADFFVPGNKIVFRAIVDMYADGEAIEVMTIHQWLVDRRQDKEAGSPGSLAGYLVGYANHLNVGSYFRIVKEKKILRDLAEAAARIAKDIHEMPDSVAGVLDRAEDSVTSILDGIGIRSETNFGMEIEEAALSIFEHAESGGGLRGLPTGFRKMDELTMGWIPGELIVVAARPGKGKTGLMLAFIKTLVENQFNVETGLADIPGMPIQMHSMEMRRYELYMRLYAMKAGVGLTKILTGDLTDVDKARITGAQNVMSQWPIFIDDTPRLDIDLLRSRMKRARRKHKIIAGFVDYLQLAKSRKYPKDRQNEVAYISGTLKEMAMENGIPIIALAQLNRVDADKEEIEPHISNIRDSGAIEQDADKIILLHQYKANTKDRPAAPGVVHYDAILAKHRNGKQGRVEMDFQSWRVFFTEAEKWGGR